jgi:predicted aspartyl protease
MVAPAGITVRFTPGEPIVVNGHLNGAPIALLLDTGADRTLLSPAAVERAGYGKAAADTAAVRVLGVTGSAVATVLTVPLLDIAGARIGPLSLIVHDAGLGGLDGLLGRDVLDAFTVTIDTAGGRATLVPR